MLMDDTKYREHRHVGFALLSMLVPKQVGKYISAYCTSRGYMQSD